MAGRKSNSALSTTTLKEKVGEEQLVRSKLAKELDSLSVRSLRPRMCVSPCMSLSVSVCLSMQPSMRCLSLIANKVIYRGSRGERAP